jgi:uncharacterized protein (TIGR02271 family)
MSKTIVGLFNSTAEAIKVKENLVANGYESSQISVVANDSENDFFNADSSAPASASTTGTGIGEKISNFFHSLSGGDEDVHNHYVSGVNQGGALLTVRAEDDEASSVAGLLHQYGAREIEDSSERSAVRGTVADVTGTTAIPVVEENLVVGKREVDRGGVRIYSHVVERPAEADVTLRDERINVARRAVDRPATAADFETGNGSFEVRASGEEAVVGKTSRVVEEVTVGKQATDHAETVRDTVRKTEVEVEQLPGEFTTTKR